MTDVVAFQREAEDSMRVELEARAKAGQVGPLPPVHYLALSGGGDKGAFGAGLVSGPNSSSSPESAPVR